MSTAKLGQVRLERVERFIQSLEATIPLYIGSELGTHQYGKYEALLEVVARMRHEFNLPKAN